MDKRYESVVNEIRDCIINFNYTKGIKLGKQFIKILNKEINNNSLKKEYCIAYYHLALNNLKLKKYKDSILFALKATEFTNKDQYDIQYINCIMLLASCYENIPIPEEAIKLYKKSSSLYFAVGLNRYALACEFSIAVINKDITYMEEIIESYEQLLNDEYDKIYDDNKQKINTLNQMKYELDKIKNTYTR